MLQGGGQMALIFYQPLPPGNKVVVYMSKINPNYAIAQQAFEENNMALVCAIPSEFMVISLPLLAHTVLCIFIRVYMWEQSSLMHLLFVLLVVQ